MKLVLLKLVNLLRYNFMMELKNNANTSETIVGQRAICPVLAYPSIWLRYHKIAN